MKNKIAVSFVFASFTFVTAQVWAGVEIGNGKYVNFKSEQLRLELDHPIEWQPYEAPEAVTLGELDVDPMTASNFKIMRKPMTAGVSLEQLRSLLEAIEPQMIWEDVMIAGRMGFKSSDPFVGKIYLLNDRNEVVSMTYRARNQKQCLEDLNFMLQSLKLF